MPLWELENFVMSPHIGGEVAEADQLRLEELAYSINLYVAGQPLPNQIDLEFGY